jgi:hypothetical protein
MVVKQVPASGAEQVKLQSQQQVMWLIGCSATGLALVALHTGQQMVAAAVSYTSKSGFEMLLHVYC